MIYIKIYIPSNKLKDILTISGSIGYDPLKHELYARCASIEANFATLRTVIDVFNDENKNYEENISNRDHDKDINKRPLCGLE